LEAAFTASNLFDSGTLLMKRLCFALLLCVVGTFQVFGGTTPDSATFQVVKVDPRLRSAFLLREMGSPSEYRYSDAGGLRSQLQTHFDAVLEILEANRERSLAIAMARLEHRQGIRWTAAQRRYWHRYLSEQRDTNIERLMLYRDRGLFPLNEGQDAEGAPIFVDKHDTACAVGHLMRKSGWDREVELIAATNLLVYVTDVRSGPLVNWVLQSGLTSGEAALIQPAYSPPFARVPINSLSGTGAGFNAPATYFDGTNEVTIANGLRYENFSWRRLHNIVSVPGIELPPGSGNTIGGSIGGSWQLEAPEHVGLRTDYDTVWSGDGWADYPAGWPYANLLTVTGFEDEWGMGGGISSGFGAFALSFDVVANHPSLSIDRIGGYLAYGFNLGYVEAWTYVTTPSGTVELTSYPYSAGGQPEVSISDPTAMLDNFYSVADLFFNGGPPTGPNEGSSIFDPQRRVTVHSFFLVRDNMTFMSTFGAFTHEIRLTAIPEPSCAALACCFAIGLVWRRN
jgi:hypothetical protein